MAETLSGRWPWESGVMRAQTLPANVATVAKEEPKVPMFTLPLVKDRRAETGRRAATAKDLIRLKRAREQDSQTYFRW